MLAKAAVQSTSMLNVRPLSRASPLPHWICVQSLSRLLKLLSILVRRQLRVLAEQSGEEARVVVTNFIADGLDALATAGQQALGRLDAQSLQVMQRFVAGSGLETTHEVADAHAVFAGHVFEAELVGEVFFEPMLDLQDDHVLVQLLPAETDPPRRIAALHFVKNVAGHSLGHVGAAKKRSIR